MEHDPNPTTGGSLTEAHESLIRSPQREVNDSNNSSAVERTEAPVGDMMQELTIASTQDLVNNPVSRNEINNVTKESATMPS